MLAKHLANEALDPIPHDGLADLARHRDADPRLRGGSRLDVVDEATPVEAPPALLNVEELAALSQAPGRREREGSPARIFHDRPYFFGITTERRLRPLRRRAARILRPPAVEVRLRNPCLLRRLRLLGWYVRFTNASSSEWKSRPPDGSRGARGAEGKCPSPACQGHFWPERVAASAREHCMIRAMTRAGPRAPDPAMAVSPPFRHRIPAVDRNRFHPPPNAPCRPPRRSATQGTVSATRRWCPPLSSLEKRAAGDATWTSHSLHATPATTQRRRRGITGDACHPLPHGAERWRGRVPPRRPRRGARCCLVSEHHHHRSNRAQRPSPWICGIKPSLRSETS